MKKIRKYLCGVLSILLTGMIFVGCTDKNDSTETNVDNKELKQSNLTERYENKELGYSFNYPSTWSGAMEYEGMPVFYFDEAGSHLMIETQEGSLESLESFKSFFEMNIEEAKDYFKAEDIKVSSIDINNYEAFNVEFIMDSDSRAIINSYYILNGDTIYIFSIFSSLISEEEREVITKEFKDMLQTIEFTK